MREIHLYGHLADRFGSKHVADFDTLGEAMWYLDVNFGGFFDAAREGSYELFHGENPLSLVEVNMSIGPGAYHIIPVIEGSGGGNTGKIVITAVIGIALVATAFVGAAGVAGMGTMQAMGQVAFAGITWGQIGLAGVALALAGVSAMLTPTPTIDSYEKRGDDSSKAVSFLFSGPVNRIEQGVCLPVVFGEFTVGSILGSGGIRVYEMDTDGGDGGGGDDDDDNTDPNDPSHYMVTLESDTVDWISTSPAFGGSQTSVAQGGTFTFTVSTWPDVCEYNEQSPWLYPYYRYSVTVDGVEVDYWYCTVTDRSVSVSNIAKNTVIRITRSN